MEKSRFDYVVFDIETTGLDPKSDRICEIGAIGVRGGLPQETFSTLVSIGGKMPARATEINGITDEMLTSAPAIGEALDGFIEFIGDMPMLVGHNISGFDIKFIIRAACETGREFPKWLEVDTLSEARRLWPELESHSMDSFRKLLGMERRTRTVRWRTAMTSFCCSMSRRLRDEALPTMRQDSARE